MQDFGEVRHLLHVFLLKTAFEAGATDVLRANMTPDELRDFLTDNHDVLPKELRKQYFLSDKDFKAFLVGVLGQWKPMLSDPHGQGQKAVVRKMIEGAADTDPELVSLLIFMLNHPEPRAVLFCALLAVLMDTPIN